MLFLCTLPSFQEENKLYDVLKVVKCDKWLLEPIRSIVDSLMNRVQVLEESASQK